MDEKEYINCRVDEQVEWYDSKSKLNQKWFKFLRGTEILCAAIIPFLAGIGSSLPFGASLIGILGVIIAVSVGVSSLSKHHEHWLMYRTTCETLKHEKFLFLTNCSPYNSDDSFELFVERIENLISKENSQWSSVTAERKHNKKINKDT